MIKKTMSHNACYGLTRVAVPLSFNSSKHFLGFSSTVNSDITPFIYRFYEHKGLYWYSITTDDGYVINSLFFVGIANCVRDFRFLCETMCWDISDSSGLSEFVSKINKITKERGF